MKTNTLKAKLARGETVIGSFIYIPSSKFTEVVSLLGFDFVVIDMEHGPVDTVVAEDMVRAAEGGGATPIIRVTHNSAHLILRALDIGAQGIHVPDINSAADARLAVSSSKYGPDGMRGLAGVRAAEYGLIEPLAQYTSKANAQTMVIAHIESTDAVDVLDDLLEIDSIDVYYLGPEDMSNSMGIPGQSKDPRVVEIVENSIRRIVAAGKVAGCIAADVPAARRYTELGARYIASHAIKFMAGASRQFVQEVRP